MKAGYCYCDIKSYVPMVACMALVALWFSDNKTKKVDSKYYNIPINIFNRGSKKIKRKYHRRFRNAKSQTEAYSH